MLSGLKSKLALNASNMIGWKTNRKIIVFESDDWGSIRMPNREVYDDFLKKGYNLDTDPYCRFDTLASSIDLDAIFGVLKRYRDKNNNHPIITFNTVVGNPNFNKIRASSFEEYYYEPFTDTLSRYYPNENVFGVWRQGINEKLIKPQFHGREHVNVPIWLRCLREGNKSLLEAFNSNFWGIPRHLYSNGEFNIQASYSSDKRDDLELYKQTIKEGLALFEDIFDFKSETFIANNYTWPLELNEELFHCGVSGLQSMRYQKIPHNYRVKLEKVFTGKISQYNQIYTVRNCIFEPSQTSSSFDDVNSCLKQIKNAFFWNKPAIISIHRLNLVGGLVERNRDQNLVSLNNLIKEILKLWPEVNFLSSDELCSLILNKNEQ